MLTRLIIFLICKKLKVKLYQQFQFVNQNSKSTCYYFAYDGLLKITEDGEIKPSTVKLNWILDPECKVRTVELWGVE